MQTDSAGRSRANLNSDFDDFQEVDSVNITPQHLTYLTTTL